MAVVFGLILGPQLFHNLDGLFGLSPAVVKVAAHDLGLFTQPAGADAKYEPASRVEVQRGDLFGLDQGVVLRNQADACAQHDLVGGAGGDGQADERVGHVAHCRWDAAIGCAAVLGIGRNRDDGMLGHPEGLKSQILSLLGKGPNVARIAVYGHVNADFHRISSGGPAV